jgi:hypothetical protein
MTRTLNVYLTKGGTIIRVTVGTERDLYWRAEAMYFIRQEVIE